MLKVGDWVVIDGLSDYKNYNEGRITRIHTNSALIDVWLEDSKDKWTINRKYLREVRKEVTKEEYINAALDLGIKDWFMSLTGDKND